jgi:Ca2+-transporting ATPase
MVLRDDAFASIVAAVHQGRVIFDNIRKFVVYLLSGNVGEILGVGAAAMVGLPLPLLPLQILYLNVLNDVFPALALGVGRSTEQVMDRPPRTPDEAVLTPHHWRLIGGYGALIAAPLLGAFLVALYPLGMGTARAVSISFLTLSLSRLLHVFNMRVPESGLFNNEITRTPYVWGALALCLGLLLLAVYWPPLAGPPVGRAAWAHRMAPDRHRERRAASRGTGVPGLASLAGAAASPGVMPSGARPARRAQPCYTDRFCNA